MDMNKKSMIYGANGYSADLIIAELIKQGIKPILAGRDEMGVRNAAVKYDCDYSIFSLNDHKEIISKLSDIHTVLNCAGPFRFTAKQMIKACLESKTNYLDITGEVDVIDYAWQNNQKAKERGVVLFPSTGFDVIPTDCLSKRLSEKLPNAKSLHLGLVNGGGISRGTLLTTFQMMGLPGKVRKDSKIIDSPIGEFDLLLNKHELHFNGISIPWGDVSSAFYSTRIPNISVFLGLPRSIFRLRKILLPGIKLFSFSIFYKFVETIVKMIVTGPTKTKRENSDSIVLGRVSDGEKEIIEAYRFFEGYKLTALGSAEILYKVLNNQVEYGTTTPSLAFGSNFMNQFVIEKII